MATFPIVEAFAKHWWVLLIRGILAVLFAIVALTTPGLVLTTLVLFYGVYALAEGLTAVWIGGSTRSWGLVLGGALSIAAGIYTFINPGIAGVALLYLIGVWAIVRGIFEIVTAIQFRKEISHEVVLIFGGIISIIFGFLFLSNIAAGVVAMAWAIGLYALVFGLTMIVQAIRLRGLPGRMENLAGGL